MGRGEQRVWFGALSQSRIEALINVGRPAETGLDDNSYIHFECPPFSRLDWRGSNLLDMSFLRPRERLQIRRLEEVRSDYGCNMISESSKHRYEPARLTLEQPLGLDLHDLASILSRSHDQLEPDDDLWWWLVLEHGGGRVDVDGLIGSAMRCDVKDAESASSSSTEKRNERRT